MPLVPLAGSRRVKLLEHHEVEIVQGDFVPVVAGTITDREGVVIDLTGATVTFSLRESRSPDTTVIDEATAQVTNASRGEVAYDWLSGDTLLPPGTYEGSFRITPASGQPFRAPTRRYVKVIIRERTDA